MLRIKQNDAVLITKYYLELKNLVKDKLIQIKRLDELESLVDIFIKIDNCLYKRQMEKE